MSEVKDGINGHGNAVRGRTGRVMVGLTAPERAVVREATGQARQLKRKHHGLYSADPRRFRKLLRAAQNAVFRQKPGPKPDREAARRIASAARMRARGARWPELYPKFIKGYGELNSVTRGYAEDGFRRRVNRHLQEQRRPKIHG